MSQPRPAAIHQHVMHSVGSAYVAIQGFNQLDDATGHDAVCRGVGDMLWWHAFDIDATRSLPADASTDRPRRGSPNCV